ncbi:MAG: DUF2279 domain-containing protein [Bacteroidota bacterium]|nr:DUF2279 domain-containing protein [Bacteroidota bacterium]
MLRQAFIGILLIIGIGGVAQPGFMTSYPDTLNKKRLVTALACETGLYVAGLSFLGYIWYKDHERVPFHLYNDSKGYLQMDKAGHGYGAYRESYAAYYAMRWAGMDKWKALIYGGTAGMIFQTPIEIFDGLYEGWGFSWSDMAANTLGSLLFITQEALFEDQIFLMKFSYSPSIYPQYHSALGESHLERFFYDYNAHTYWLSGNVKRLTGIEKIPDWLNIAFGYSANGMIYEFDNPLYYKGKPFPYFERYRQYIFSFDIDCSRIPTKKKWLRNVLRAVNLIKIPFPAIEFNQIGEVKFRPLYF